MVVFKFKDLQFTTVHNIIIIKSLKFTTIEKCSELSEVFSILCKIECLLEGNKDVPYNLLLYFFTNQVSVLINLLYHTESSTELTKNIHQVLYLLSNDSPNYNYVPTKLGRMWHCLQV